MAYRILVADDHEMFLAGLSAALENEPELSVVSFANEGISAIAQIKRYQPDCAILDQQMPGANGREVFEEARKWSPETKFILLTGLTRPGQIQDFFQVGYSGVLLKTSPVSEIIEGVKKVLSGEAVLDKNAKELMPGQKLPYVLTARETETLKLIALGLSNVQIAAKLEISPKTVDSHRTNLMKKMAVNSAPALTTRAIKDGWIDP